MFAGKSVIITGSGSGIGKVTAKAFAAEGAAVAVNDIEEQYARDTVAEIKTSGGRAIACVADISNWESVQAMVAQTVAEFGRIDVLVNNARMAKGLSRNKGPFWEYPIEDWDKEIAVNLKGVMLCCKAVLPAMFSQHSGCIINISSTQAMLGSHRGRSGLAVYAATKAAVVNFTKSLAKDVADYGVRVCCVAPGTIDTPGLSEISKPEKLKPVLENVLLGRLGKSEEVADTILFLASERASYITGVCLPVDGGRSSY